MYMEFAFAGDLGSDLLSAAEGLVLINGQSLVAYWQQASANTAPCGWLTLVCHNQPGHSNFTFEIQNPGTGISG